jgi:hypothetical protein
VTGGCPPLGGERGNCNTNHGPFHIKDLTGSRAGGQRGAVVPVSHVLAFAAVVTVLIGGTGGLVMIGLGVSLAATGRKD